MNRKYVSICIPMVDSVQVEWVLRTWNALSANPQEDFAKFIRLMRGSLSVAQKRNQTVQVSLEDPKVTHILFIDHDILYEGKFDEKTGTEETDVNTGIRKLLNYNVDIVSGLLRCRQTGYPYMAYFLKDTKDMVRNVNDDDLMDNKLNHYDIDPLMRVDSLGCSFVLISRSVFEKVPKPWFVADPCMLSTEDIQFFIRAKNLGIQSYLATDVRLTHMCNLKIHSDGTVGTVY